MTELTGDFMGRNDHVLQERLVRLLHSRERYRRDGAKNLARDIRVEERTARNILSGHWPRAEHLRRIITTFGMDALGALFGPDLDAEMAHADQALRDAEERYELAKAHRRALEGRAEALARPLAAHEDGSA